MTETPSSPATNPTSTANPAPATASTSATTSATPAPGTVGTAGTAESASLHERLVALAERQIAEGEVLGVAEADPVNIPMIRHWTDAMGDTNPLYTDPEAAAAGVHGGIVAPPAMIQVWTMPGVGGAGRKRAGSPIDAVLALLDGNGYTGVVATNCEQTYHRYVRLGESLIPSTRLTGVTGPKRTALGEGYFVTWNITWYADGEAVADMLFRVLKFRPRERAGGPGEDATATTTATGGNGAAASGNGLPPASEAPSGTPPAQAGPAQDVSVQAAPAQAAPATGTDATGTEATGTDATNKDATGGDTTGKDASPRAPYPLRPAVNADTAFFWEGVAAGELRIQRCADCGELRHPPGPVCPSCRSAARTFVTASGEGEVYSYVVHHNPPVPGLRPPFVVAVVELPEGVRIVGNVVDCDASRVGIGMPVRLTYRQMDDELILPMWVPLEA
ncbi:bifunctional MaoC family dehydratase N-terminal/OB-fold nucleic acid binding domain-containing protein [Streptosporangium sp. NPDC002524]|uniref:bifunctional MaoC family dehydratase N-terminal/OB-fold nucleic acid binding domain-containing protein n=1 Tax=Streptosporangium sp. NPDC002524 TaxID=3154537 RepID=UPI003324A84C